MKSKTGIEICEGQRWVCTDGSIVEVVLVRKPPEGSVREDVVGGYIKSAHLLVTMEADDFVSEAPNGVVIT